MYKLPVFHFMKRSKIQKEWDARAKLPEMQSNKVMEAHIATSRRIQFSDSQEKHFQYGTQEHGCVPFN